jgi:hypothetical protein
MEIEDRIANTELVVSAGRGRSDSDMISILLMRKCYGCVHSKVRYIMA